MKIIQEDPEESFFNDFNELSLKSNYREIKSWMKAEEKMIMTRECNPEGTEGLRPSHSEGMTRKVRE